MKFREAMQARWAEMDTRERRLVTAAVTLVLLALVWWVALAPALNTLSAAREEHKRLDAQLQRMSTLQAQAKALQAQPRANRDESLRAHCSGPAPAIAPMLRPGRRASSRWPRRRH